MTRAGARIVGAVVAVAWAGTVSPAAAQQRPPSQPAQRRPPAATTTAPQAGALKLAYVDQRRVFSETPGFAAAESTFVREREGYVQELQKLQSSLDSAASTFETESITLSPTQRQARRKDLETKQQQLEQRTQELRDRAVQRERELLAPIHQRVFAVIEGLRSERAYAMIFDVSSAGSGILTADKALDITAEVIQRLKQGS